MKKDSAAKSAIRARRSFAAALVAGTVASCAGLAGASPVLWILSDPSGLSAEVEFDLINPTTLQVRARNTSTGVPLGFSNADQLLTSISWEFAAGTDVPVPSITGGSVMTGPTSSTVNFSITNVGPNGDVSGEWGYGNTAISGNLANFITTLQAGATKFPGANMDGPEVLDGPQGGLVASPHLVALGGLGAIENEIIATLTLSHALTSLDFATLGLVRVEFGSDAFFITVPTPGSLGLLALGGVALIRRRRA